MSDIKNRIDKIKEQIIDTKIGREILGLTEYDEIVDDFKFLITTIESQNIQIESLKAITELAEREKVELFDEGVRQKKRAILAEKQLKLATIGLNYIMTFPFLESTEDIRIIKRNSSDVLEANERLQNGTT